MPKLFERRGEVVKQVLCQNQVTVGNVFRGDSKKKIKGLIEYINMPTAARACSKTLDYCEFMSRAANGGSERLKISTIFFAF
ncbi:hypothetical protein L0Y46_00545, partial [bacterium]|nr:hypothetical protein [bacterium]MCI0679962.1 hypothetical protein [bacterium]